MKNDEAKVREGFRKQEQRLGGRWKRGEDANNGNVKGRVRGREGPMGRGSSS